MILLTLVFSMMSAHAKPILECDASLARVCQCPIDSEQIANASPACKSELDRVFLARKQAAYRAGGALTGFGGLMSGGGIGSLTPLFSYDGRVTPAPRGGISDTENRGSISSPVYATKKDVLAVSLNAGQVHFGEQPTLDSGLAAPTDLTRFEVGAQYMHQLEGKRNWGLRAAVGYAGDNPSIIPGDLSYSLSASYGFPGSGRGYWMTFIFIANNSALPNYIPIPGVIYFYKTDTFTGMFGFPITSLQWTPAGLWAYSFSIFGPIVQMEAANGHLDNFQGFVLFSANRQTYIPHVRPDDRDRLTFEENKLGIGCRFPIVLGTLLEFQVGDSFARKLVLSDGLLSGSQGEADLGSSWYASTNFKWAF